MVEAMIRKYQYFLYKCLMKISRDNESLLKICQGNHREGIPFCGLILALIF